MIFWFQFTQTYCLVEDSSVILAGIEERRPRFFYTVFYSNLLTFFLLPVTVAKRKKEKNVSRNR